MAHRTLQFRGYCSRNGYAVLDGVLGELCRLANAAIQERRDVWSFQRKSISFYDQCRSLTEVRHDDPDSFLGRLNVSASRGALRFVNRAYQAFFRRVQLHQKPGYPRFRSGHRYKTIEIKDVRANQVAHDGKHVLLRINGLPPIRLRMRRPLPDAKPSTIRITRRSRG